MSARTAGRLLALAALFMTTTACWEDDGGNAGSTAQPAASAGPALGPADAGADDGPSSPPPEGAEPPPPSPPLVEPEVDMDALQFDPKDFEGPQPPAAEAPVHMHNPGK